MARSIFYVPSIGSAPFWGFYYCYYYYVVVVVRSHMYLITRSYLKHICCRPSTHEDGTLLFGFLMTRISAETSKSISFYFYGWQAPLEGVNTIVCYYFRPFGSLRLLSSQ